MKKIKLITLFSALLFVCIPVEAQVPGAQVITTAVKKVLRAIDLKVQRLQNKTIWLQNAQKAVENKMAALKLGEIKDWTERQKDLYASYFEELNKVKAVIANHHRVKDIIQQQLQVVLQQRRGLNNLYSNQSFSEEERIYLKGIYEGILEQSLVTIDDLLLVVQPFSTKMTDSKRLEMIAAIENDIGKLLTDVRQLNERNGLLELQRNSEKNEIALLKKIYGL